MLTTDLQILFNRIMRARERIYRLARPTPLEKLFMPNGEEVYLKREDISPVHSYKWRGAYNMMASLGKDDLAKGVVAASAGNHAQGVALSAHNLGCSARIFMPRSTPRMKIREVERLGGENVEVVISGDNYDEASVAASG